MVTKTVLSVTKTMAILVTKRCYGDQNNDHFGDLSVLGSKMSVVLVTKMCFGEVLFQW